MAVRYFSIGIKIFSVFCFLFLQGCSNDQKKAFTLLSPQQTKITFENNVVSTEELNIQNYGYFYDGGGVSVGDINNDGLPDIYFTANEKENKLYLNKGDYVFEDITEMAGVGGGVNGWSTGTTMVDVNGDGFLDIYVSRVNYRSKSGANQLFINNGDGTFTEQAEKYGLDFRGYSKQAVFFDYNNDGALDMFLLNHSIHGKNTVGRPESLRVVNDSLSGDRLFRNEGGVFVDISDEAGIYSSALGYGLGVAVSDLNLDGWLDIYVGNDFHENDYLYINNGDGTFTEALTASFKHTTLSSMGNDIADLNNDGRVEVVSLDMLPKDNAVLRRSGIISSYSRMETNLRLGYKPQVSHNTLQLNRGFDSQGIPLFSDIGYLTGIAATNWSWATLLMDMDNDGMKDIFITNGLIGNPTDIDYNILLQQRSQISLSDKNKANFDLINKMPPIKVSNYAFKNDGDQNFKNVTGKWGFNKPGYSSGAAYADLNNNGSLDLIINNVNMSASIYRNNTVISDTTNYLKIKFEGRGLNKTGIGAKVIVYKQDDVIYQEQIPTRGFQSSVDHAINIGLGESSTLDSLLVIWPDHSYQTIYDVDINQTINLYQEEALEEFNYEQLHETKNEVLFENISDKVSVDYNHEENRYSDFQHEPFLPYKLSTSGPAVAWGDVNGDGLDDIFLGGAHGQVSKLFIQDHNGSFLQLAQNESVFESDISSEDVSALFFDSNSNGLLDLYVVSGGNELNTSQKTLKDRLYINLGDGIFSKSKNKLPEFYENGSVVTSVDFNNDGYKDLFIGTRKSKNLRESPNSVLLKNDGNGKFIDVTDKIAPGLRKAGMITDAVWADVTDSGFPDLILAGEWMPITLYKNDGTVLLKSTENEVLNQSNGLWFRLLVDDFNNDGKLDIVAGNFGENSRLKASIKNPLRLYTQDFENNGLVSNVIAYSSDGAYYPLEPLTELVRQFPVLNRKIESFTDYSVKTLDEIFGTGLVNEADFREIYTLKSTYFENQGNGKFLANELPAEAQISPVFGMYSNDFNSDGNKDLLISGNLYGVKPSIGGRQDAGYGLLLTGDGVGGFNTVSLQSSGFIIEGESREIIPIRNSADELLIVVIRNDHQPQIFRRANETKD